jgi:hypothetical protein
VPARKQSGDSESQGEEGGNTVSLQQQFASKVDDLIAQSGKLGPEATKKVLELLNEARIKILGELTQLTPDSFNAAQLNVLKKSIERAMATFSHQASSAVIGLESKAFELGQKTITTPLDSAGLSSAFGQVSTSSLSVAQGYTADLISGLSNSASASVNAAIQRAFIGGQSITDIIGQIGKALPGDKGFTGLFSPVGKRATAIATNEILRVHSIAAQAKLEDAAERHPELMKQWKHLAIALRPRIGHEIADGQTQKVEDPFQVEGEDLMYPRDPNGSAENTINCHCLMVPYFPAGALQASAEQKGLLDDLGISVSAA